MNGNHKFRKWMICCVSIVLFLLVVCATVVVIIDPFFHFHAPLSNFPYVIDNQLSQNPGLARHMKYDSVITGSSMTANFDTDWYHDDMGLDTLKLTCNGAYPKDISNMLCKVYESENKVKAVFASLDIETFTAGTEEVKYPVPEYLYDRNPFNDAQYLFNKDVITEYIIRPLIVGDPTDMTDMYASWWTPDYYDEAKVVNAYEIPEQTDEVSGVNGDQTGSNGTADGGVKVDQADSDETVNDGIADSGVKAKSIDCYIAGAIKNLDANICPYIEAHPETEFYLFFPAYSVLFWNDMKAGNEIDARLNEYCVIADRLLEYKNVKLFFFADDSDEITDLNNYADMIHAKPEWSRYMTKCFSNGTYEVDDSDEVREHTEHLRKIIEGYDYDSLFKKYGKR